MLKTSRAINILVVLAQAIASLILIIRRRHIEHATLLLDSTNGLYAIIGIMTACNSLMILAIDGSWDTIEDTDLDPRHLKDTTYPNFAIENIVHTITVAAGPTMMMHGQHLLEHNLSGSLAQKKWLPPLTLSQPPLPTVITHTLLFTTTGLWGLRVLIYQHCYKSGNKFTFKATLTTFGFLLGGIVIASIPAQHINYWISFFPELAIIKNGCKLAFWGVDTWKWYDPLSDIFFVY